MQALKRFLHLSKQERSLLLKAALATIVVRLSLALLSLPTVQRLAVNLSWGNGESLNPTRIVWAMRAVARLVPGSTCLVQALAAQALLIRYGYRPLVTIGVTKDECDRFGAHAWVTCENQVLIGGQYVENYTALLNLGS